MRTISLPCIRSRRIEDPIDTAIVRHELLVSAYDADWEDIPDGLNPRGNAGSRNLERGVYADIREAAEAGGDFHRLNGGITLTARRVEPDPGNKDFSLVTFEPSIPDGHLDGVGTLTILRAAQAAGTLAEDTYVRVEVWTGLDKDQALAMAEARNERGAVTDWSQANARGHFDAIRHALEADPRAISTRIEWAEGLGDPNKVSATSADVVLTLVAFNPVINPKAKPIQTYGAAKMGALSRFQKKPGELDRMALIAGDILDLHDYIGEHLADWYKLAHGPGSRPGGWALLRALNAPKLLPYTTRRTSYEPYSAVVLPTLAAFRQFVTDPGGNAPYEWDRPFPDLLAIADAAGPAIVAALQLGADVTEVQGKVNVNALGKHLPTWSTLEDKLTMAAMRMP